MNRHSSSASNEVQPQPTTAPKAEGPNTIASDANAGQPPALTSGTISTQNRTKGARSDTTKPQVRLYTEADLGGSVHPPTYILRPIMPRGRLIVLLGDSTAGKTPFQYQLIGSLLAQRDFLGFKNEAEEPLRIGMIDAESLADDIKFRIRLQSSVWPETFRQDSFIFTDRETTTELKLNVGSQIANIKTLVEKHHLDVLFLDNLWALSDGKDIAKGHVASPIITKLNDIISLPWKPSVVLVHHKRKSASGGDPEKQVNILDHDFMAWFQEMSGTMVWINRTDVRLGLARIVKNGNEYTVLRGRHRVPGGEQDIGPFFLTIDEDRDVALISNSPDVLETIGEKKKEIAGQMRQKQHFTREEALRQPIRCDASKKTVYRTIKTLIEHGFLSEEPNGTYHWQVIKGEDGKTWTPKPSSSKLDQMNRVKKFVQTHRGSTVRIADFKKEESLDDDVIEMFRLSVEQNNGNYANTNIGIEWRDDQTFLIEAERSPVVGTDTQPMTTNGDGTNKTNGNAKSIEETVLGEHARAVVMKKKPWEKKREPTIQ